MAIKGRKVKQALDEKESVLERNGGDDHDCYVLGTEVTLRRTIGEGSEATWHGIAVSAGRRRTGPS